jgi:hypothetical protein
VPIQQPDRQLRKQHNIQTQLTEDTINDDDDDDDDDNNNNNNNNFLLQKL